MAIFAKKPEWGELQVTPPAVPTGSPGRTYGIADAIQLMRTLPVDQHPDLIVRVVRATLASLNVHLADIIEDAARKQKSTQERVASVHGQIAELEKQLDVHRREIAALEADLKETTSVKERLQMAEKLASSSRLSPGAEGGLLGKQPYAKAPELFEETPIPKD